METAQPFGPPTEVIDVGHSRVPYYRVGRGPDVFLVHGWPLYSATFREIVPRLSDNYTCHLIDLPGTGASRWGRHSRISLRDHATTVRAVVDQIGLSSFAFVAHDSGAVIARLCAASDPRVRGLVIGNTEIPGYHCWQVQAYVWIDRIPLGALLFGAALQLKAVRHSNLAYGGCFSDPQYTEGEFRKLFIAPLERSPRLAYGQRRLIKTFDWSVIDELALVHAKISAPVKLIWGAQDPYFPLEKLRPTVDQFGGGATLTVLDPGKLFVHEERPDEFARETRQFLDECFAAASTPRLDARRALNS